MLTEQRLAFKKILAVGWSDLRKGTEGPAVMIRLKYNLDPLEDVDTLVGKGRVESCEMEIIRNLSKQLTEAYGKVHSADSSGH